MATEVRGVVGAPGMGFQWRRHSNIAPFLTFPEHGVAAGHGDGGVPAIHGNWEVEGGDDADNSQGVPVLQKGMARPFAWNNLELLFNDLGFFIAFSLCSPFH